MNLTIVTHNLCRGDGQGRVNYELARYCLTRGVRTTLMADVVAQELIDAGANWIPLRPRWKKPNLFKTWQFAALADRALDRSEPGEVVVANGFVLRRPHAFNVSHFVHDAWLRSPAHISRLQRGFYASYQRRYTQCNARWEKKSYQAAGRVIAVSRKVRGELIGIGIPADRIHVLLNGVDLSEFRPGKESPSELGLPSGVPLALFVGDIRTSRKNLDTVLRAMGMLRGLHLAVVGAASASPFPEMARRLGLSDRVHFLGFRRDVARIMRACDLFVFPSRYEACSLVLLEALASGLPVVTAATAGGSELVSEECGQVLSDAEDAGALASAMERFTDDAGFQRRASGSARATAEQHGWDQMAQRYLELFQEKSA